MNKYNEKQTATQYILKSLVPYTDANLKLVYKPKIFFDELERLDQQNTKKSSYSRATLKASYYKAKQKGYFEIGDDERPQLTEKGNSKLVHFKPKKIKNGKMLVIFDIPEKYRRSRNKFRALLVACKFKQVQRSVWISDYDSREILYTEIDALHLQGEVHIFEANDITPRELLNKE